MNFSESFLISVPSIRECIVEYIGKMEDILPIYSLSAKFLFKISNRTPENLFDNEFLQFHLINDFSLVDICKDPENSVNAQNYVKFLINNKYGKYLDLAFHYAVENKLKEQIIMMIKAGAIYHEMAYDLKFEFENHYKLFQARIRGRFDKSSDNLGKIEDGAYKIIGLGNIEAQGITGPQGITGASGPPGAAGPSGPQGFFTSFGRSISVGSQQITSNNVGIGQNSLISLASGSNNTAVGSQSLTNKRTPSFSKVINCGSKNELLFDGLENVIMFGNSAYAVESNEFVLGSALHPLKTITEGGVEYLKVTLNGRRAAIPIKYYD